MIKQTEKGDQYIYKKKDVSGLLDEKRKCIVNRQESQRRVKEKHSRVFTLFLFTGCNNNIVV